MKVIYTTKMDLKKRKTELELKKIDEDKIYLKKIFYFLWGITIFSLVSIAYIYQYARLSAVKNDIIKIKREIFKLQGKKNEIERELVKLKDIKRIKKMATGYGMKEADVIKFIKLD